MRFGLRLKELRAERMISQDFFAHSIGMSRAYYAEVEIGKRNISLDNINRIAMGFNISIAELFNCAAFGGDEVLSMQDDEPSVSISYSFLSL